MRNSMAWRSVVLCFLLFGAALGKAAERGGETHSHVLTHTGEYKLSVIDYNVPADLTLIRDDGRKVRLSEELDDGRPVVLNFIYTTCPGICPLMSQVFSEFQDRLGADRQLVHMVSISIDPEQDTPARLKSYARKFSAGSQWQHYTGTVASSIAAQRVFGAYQGDKMSHDPLTLMRSAPGKPWVRIDGFATGVELVQQYLQLAALCERKPA